MKKSLIIVISIFIGTVIGIIVENAKDKQQTTEAFEPYTERFRVQRGNSSSNLAIYVATDKETGEQYMISRFVGCDGVAVVHLEHEK